MKARDALLSKLDVQKATGGVEAVTKEEVDMIKEVRNFF